MTRRTIGSLAIAAGLAVWLAFQLRPSRVREREVLTPPSSPPPQSSPSDLTSLEVVVRSSSGPVAQARVGLVLGDDLVATGQTGADGAIVLRNLAAGRLRLIVTHPQHVRHERSVQIPSGPSRVELELPAAALLRVRVEDARGKPIAAARVRVVAEGDRERGRCETNSAGLCEVGELEPAAVVVHAYSGRHRPGRAEVRPEHRGAPTELTLRLSEGRALSGRVVDDRGRGVPGARIGSSDEGSGFVEADDDGRFELGGLGDAPVNLFATAEGFAPRHMQGLRTGSANVEIRLDKPASLEANVEFATGASSLMVSVCEYNTHFSKEVCVARRLFEPPEKLIALEGLAAGSYELVLEATGHHPERVRVHLSVGQRSRLGAIRLRAAP